MSDVELTKEERDVVHSAFDDSWSMAGSRCYEVAKRILAFERKRQAEKVCVWRFTLDEWEHRKWVSGCGGEAPIYFFPISDVPFKFCPDCGSRIQIKES